MKTLTVLIGLFLATDVLNLTADLNSVRGYIESASYLEQQNNPLVARQILKSAYQATKHISLLSHWLAMDEAMFLKLKQKHKRYSITRWKTEFKKKCLNQWHYGLHCSEYDRQKELAHQEKTAISTSALEEVRTVLNKYNQLKTSLTERQSLLDSLEKSGEDSAKIKQMLAKHQALVNKVKRTRSDYLSFDVISPYLARTEQLVFISSIYNPKVSSILTLLPDKSLSKFRSIEKLREAAKIFANVADQEILLDSNSTVRKQFVGVLKNFKEIAGPAQFKEFKPIKAIADKLKRGKERHLGAQRWWK
jgi:hypothetical protein